MDDRLRSRVWFVAVQLVFMAALLHLAVGVYNWLRWYNAGFLVPQDWRWPVFIASALVIYYGLHRAIRADNRRPYYLVGIVVMLGYVLGYFAWHIAGHPLFLGAPPPAGEETLGLQWFLDHLFAGPIEFFAIAIETLAATLLGVLYVLTPAGGAAAPDDPPDDQETASP